MLQVCVLMVQQQVVHPELLEVAVIRALVLVVQVEVEVVGMVEVVQEVMMQVEVVLDLFLLKERQFQVIFFLILLYILLIHLCLVATKVFLPLNHQQQVLLDGQEMEQQE